MANGLTDTLILHMNDHNAYKTITKIHAIQLELKQIRISNPRDMLSQDSIDKLVNDPRHAYCAKCTKSLEQDEDKHLIRIIPFGEAKIRSYRAYTITCGQCASDIESAYQSGNFSFIEQYYNITLSEVRSTSDNRPVRKQSGDVLTLTEEDAKNYDALQRLLNNSTEAQVYRVRQKTHIYASLRESHRLQIKKDNIKEKLFKKQAGVCPDCSTSFPIEKLTIEHVIPIGFEGGCNIRSFQLLCHPCNISRGALLRSKITSTKDDRLKYVKKFYGTITRKGLT